MRQRGSGWFQSGLVAVGIRVVAACGSFSSNEASEPPAPDADGGGTGGGDGAPGVGNSASPFVVSLQAGPRVELVRGKRTDVVVQIERRNGYVGEAVITVRDLPQGVVAEPLVVLPGAKIGTLGLTATQAVPHGIVEPVLVASAGADKALPSAEAKFELVLRGAAGDLDETFGKRGVVELSLPGVSFGGMASQSDGNLVYAGAGPTAASVVVGRLFADGTVDTTFGMGGTRRFAFGAGADYVRDVLVQPDGKIIVVGLAGAESSGALARFTAAGAVDTSFAGSGIAKLGANTRIRRARLADDGAIFLLLGGGDTINIFKITSKGVLDATFGGGTGAVAISKSAFPQAVLLSASSLAVSATSVVATFTVVREAGLSRVGIATVPRVGGPPVFGETSFAEVTQYENPVVLRSDDNSAVVAFNSRARGSEERGLFGFLPDGRSADPNFGTSGGYSFWASNELSFAMVEDEAHRLLIAGRNRLAPAKFVLLRHLPKGAPDPSFGVAGASVTLIGDESNAIDIAVQKDGRIVVGGERTAGAVLAPAFARYWP